MSKSPAPVGAFGVLIRLAVFVLALAYTGEKIAGLKSIPFAVGSASHNVLIVFAYWAELLQPGFALCALWAASTLFGSLGRGDAFKPAVVKGMRGVGLNLLFGAFGALVLVPLFNYLAYGAAPLRVYGPYIESLTFGLIGLVFYMLARQGQALKSELEQFV